MLNRTETSVLAASPAGSPGCEMDGAIAPGGCAFTGMALGGLISLRSCWFPSPLRQQHRRAWRQKPQ